MSALDALVDEIAERVVARLAPLLGAAPSHYCRERPPPEAASWRAVLEAGRRNELRVDRVGRAAVVSREEWERYLSSRRRRGPVAVEDADARALAAMGVVLPMRGRR